MTLVAVWMTDDRLMAIADTRISRSVGNVLTEHGPKLVPLQIVCKQPGDDGFFSRETYRADIGFAYAGSTLSALATHALADTLLSKLAGPPAAPPPMLYEIAMLVAGAGAEYMREVGQLSGHEALFSAVVFGQCPATQLLKVFLLTPDLKDGVRVNVVEQSLAPIRLAGSAAQSVVVIGSAPELLVDEINKHLVDAVKRGETHEIVAYDAPKRALRALIDTNRDERIGGIIQQAWATAAGFEIVGNLEPITPVPPSTRNAGLFVLGFDTIDVQSVGQYFVSTGGR